MNIVADASALLAILLGEPDADQLLSKLLLARTIRISPVNWWEVQVRMSARYGEAGEAGAARWMTQVGIAVEPVTLRQAEIALSAYARYRGRPGLKSCQHRFRSSGRRLPTISARWRR